MCWGGGHGGVRPTVVLVDHQPPVGIKQSNPVVEAGVAGPAPKEALSVEGELYEALLTIGKCV